MAQGTEHRAQGTEHRAQGSGHRAWGMGHGINRVIYVFDIADKETRRNGDKVKASLSGFKGLWKIENWVLVKF